MTGITNPLGAFTYAYVNATGRPDHVIYPNSQRTNYAYYNNAGDQRLQQIENLKPDASNLSTFTYTYDAEGIIQAWTRKFDAGSVLTSDFKYDLADQLTEAIVPTVSSAVTDFVYRYDKAGNRTSEQIDNAVAAGTHNNLNQLKALSSTGPIRFAGSLNEAGTVTVNGQAVAVAGDNSFSGDVALPPGSNSVAVVAKDPLNNTTTKNYTVPVASGTARTLTYDFVGNLTDNGAGQTYEWDAVNRLTKITQSSGITEFVYDGNGRRVKEKLNGAEIKRWIWCDEPQPCEERDGSNSVTKRFYAGLGEQVGSTNYFYTTDHLGSVREMTNSSGTIQTRFDYDPYGRLTKLSGSLEASFGFTGFHRHPPSGLNLTLYRAYSADLGRWLNRDLIGERGGTNLYGYVGNNPISYTDPLGLSRASYDGNVLMIKVPFWKFWDRGFQGTGYNVYLVSPSLAQEILKREGVGDAMILAVLGAVLASGRDDGAYDSFDKARETAQKKCGDLGEDTQKEYDPATGTLVGEKSKDGKRGWRNDPDHFNWWDWSEGKKGGGGRYGHEYFPPGQGGPSSPPPSKKP